jgi:hypothetical protein
MTQGTEVLHLAAHKLARWSAKGMTAVAKFKYTTSV